MTQALKAQHPNEHESNIAHVQEQTVRIEAHITEQLDTSPSGHAVSVTVIQGGVSKNGYAYDEQTLRNIAHMLEGAHAYADHSTDVATRSVRDVVGFYHDTRYIAGTGTGRVDATLHIFDAADWLWSLIHEACQLGRPELIGLSIDILGQWQLNEATQTKEVTQVIALNSCDVVTRPSAGGTFHALPSHSRKGALTGMPNTSNPSANQENAIIEAEQQHRNASPVFQLSEDAARLSAEQQQLNTLMNEMQVERAQMHLERRLLESVFPEPVRTQIRNRFSGRAFTSEELEREMGTQRDLLAALSASGLITGHGYEKPAIGQMISEAEKIQAAFDGMFDLDIDVAKVGGVRPFTSIREAYTRVTGDSSVGGFSDRSQLGTIRVSEAAPINRISEADTTTASFSYLLGTSMNKRLLKDYQAWPAEWQKFVTIAPIRDFKQQTRVRLGAFGSLPIVAEDTAYSAVTLSDSAAVYVPQKRGNLVTVSRETIINDDLQAIKQIPTKLAVAAAYTLAEFVYVFLSGNANIYDGNALFTSGAPHSNLGASALSTASMQLGITAMREQANYAGKRIGLRPRFLIVPPELEWVAMVATKSAGVPGSNNNDINPMLGYVTPIVSPQLSSSTQWFFAADPREIDTIEIGFVGGQVNPALFIQDQPLFGLNFTQDAISYKIRHEYGGAVVDYRGLYRGV